MYIIIQIRISNLSQTLAGVDVANREDEDRRVVLGAGRFGVLGSSPSSLVVSNIEVSGKPNK